MHKLIIHKLGPVDQCELECVPFLTLTGFQASGKSVVAKAIYYFRTIKEDFMELAQRQVFHMIPSVGFGDDDDYDLGYGLTLEAGLQRFLCEKFFRVFGPMYGISPEMQMQYSYTENCSITVSYAQDHAQAIFRAEKVTVVFSDTLKKFLREKNKSFSVTPTGIPEQEKKLLEAELCQIFDDRYGVVYIPAGRSMLTLLSQQFSYIYATMDDFQKQSLDLCTRDYLERILRLRPEFQEGLLGLQEHVVRGQRLTSEIVQQALSIISQILRGTYQYKSGEEQIQLESGNYVKINFSSSGQQESVWILNLLFYYLLQKKPILFIIEEPESHLFPESQKLITELIALVNHCGHEVLLTTHSPYVLGALNNLLYANTLKPCFRKKAGEVIPDFLWLDDSKFDAWFVKEGTVENAMDEEIQMIQNERIDEISKVINHDFDRLLELQNADAEGGGLGCQNFYFERQN